MPMEHDVTREPKGVRIPRSVHVGLWLGSAGLLVFSMVRNGGDAGLLTAIGAGGLGLALGYLVRLRQR